MYNVPEDAIYLTNCPWDELPSEICPICGHSEWDEDDESCLVCKGDKDWNI